MPRQEAPFGSRTSTEQMTESIEQVAQFYETEGDRNAAFGTEDIPTGLITHLGNPPSEELRWARHDGGGWVGAFLAPTLNSGWVSNLVVADRTKETVLTATVRLNEPVPAGRTYTVQYKTTDGTARAAEGDFTAIPLTTLTFVAGEREKEVMVTVAAQTSQPVEEFYLDLSNPSEGSTTFGIGGRLTIDLTGDTSPLTLRLADATVDEGNAASTTATINREATGDFTFTWSTRQQASPINRAPASLYTPVASASATIPEGSTSVNLVTQTVEVNAQTNVRNQTFEIVVPQSSLMVAGGDTIATVGHDLVAQVVVARNQYVAPNVTINPYPQWATRDEFLAFYGWAVYNSDDNAYEYFTPSGVITRRNDNTTWPTLAFRGTLSTGNQLLGAHFYLTISDLYVSDDSTSSWFLLQPRTYRVEIGGTGSLYQRWFQRINFLPLPTDGAHAFYSKASYEDLRIRFQSPLFRLTYNRASGLRLPGNVATLTRNYNYPAA